MQLDALTAGALLILVQLCISLVMAGLFYALPTEKCTRYWALSAFQIAVGLTIVILNAGALRYALLIIGNNLVILGMIYQWRGLRAFYKRPASKAGWIVGALFFIGYALSLIQNASVPVRSLIAALAIWAMLCLYMYEFLPKKTHNRSFASWLGTTSVAILLAGYTGRVVFSAFQLAQVPSSPNSIISVILLYFIPVVGTLLLSCALVLLYFERIVADKDHLATYDELTKVFNRRAIDASAEREVAVARRLGKPLAAAFIDIDHFKNINDRHGHAVGDLVLFQVAQLLKKTCRNIDLIGRYGGEEFCIVFPNMDQAACHVIGHRLVTAVNEHVFADIGNATISVGIALLNLEKDDQDWQALVKLADHELYKAKHAGRNRCQVYHPV